ncbi:MAG: SMC-Scp complex subunit ScpB [Bacillota bacterium]
MSETVDLGRELARGVIEAMLFAASVPLSVPELAAASGLEASVVKHVLEALTREFGAAGRGVRLEYLGGGYQLLTRPEYAPVLEKLGRTRTPPQLSRAALETLAIVAYRQPVTRAEMDAIRGVRSDATIATLLERGLICEDGRKNVVGRPILYATTRHFLEQFGLGSLDQLPPLPEEDQPDLV